MSLNAVMKKIEIEPMKECEEIKPLSIVTPTKNKDLIGESFINIIINRNKEFEKTTGRPMTYSEMREMF